MFNEHNPIESTEHFYMKKKTKVPLARKQDSTFFYRHHPHPHLCRNMFDEQKTCHASAVGWFENPGGYVLQGQPLGFDTKYLALGDRNIQVRCSLKVVWEA